MDKIDEYLKIKSKEEKEMFTLPKSFNNKVNNVLNNLDTDKRENNKEYKDRRKFFVIAASIAFILVIGKVMLFVNSVINDESVNSKLAKSESAEGRAFNGIIYEEKSSDKDEFKNIMQEIENNNIEKITINNIEIKDANRINEIISYIKCVNAEYYEKEKIENSLVVMKLYGDKSYNIYIGNKCIEINNQVFKSSEEEINNLLSLIM